MYLVSTFLMFISYAALCSNKDALYTSPLKLLYIISFLFFSVLTRLSINFSDNADYVVYYLNDIYNYNITLSLTDILKEPLFKILYQICLFLTDDKMKAVHCIYWLNFSLITILFIKISNLHLIFYKKIMLFTIFYFLFTYTLLRNGIPYLLIFLFFYWLNYSNIIKKNNLIVASLIHISALIPVFVIFLTKIKVSQIKYILMFLALIVLISIFGFNISLDLIFQKFKAYANVDHNRNLFHVVWTLIVAGFFILSFFENKKTASTKLNIGLFLVYIVLNILNPVMGYRTSIYYLIFYFSITINNYFFLKNRNLFNFISLILIVMLYVGLFSTHTFQ